MTYELSFINNIVFQEHYTIIPVSQKTMENSVKLSYVIKNNTHAKITVWTYKLRINEESEDVYKYIDEIDPKEIKSIEIEIDHTKLNYPYTNKIDFSFNFDIGEKSEYTDVFEIYVVKKNNIGKIGIEEWLGSDSFSTEEEDEFDDEDDDWEEYIPSEYETELDKYLDAVRRGNNYDFFDIPYSNNYVDPEDFELLEDYKNVLDWQCYVDFCIECGFDPNEYRFYDLYIETLHETENIEYTNFTLREVIEEYVLLDAEYFEKCGENKGENKYRYDYPQIVADKLFDVYDKLFDECYAGRYSETPDRAYDMYSFEHDYRVGWSTGIFDEDTTIRVGYDWIETKYFIHKWIDQLDWAEPYVTYINGFTYKKVKGETKFKKILPEIICFSEYMARKFNVDVLDVFQVNAIGIFERIKSGGWMFDYLYWWYMFKANLNNTEIVGNYSGIPKNKLSEMLYLKKWLIEHEEIQVNQELLEKFAKEKQGLSHKPTELFTLMYTVDHEATIFETDDIQIDEQLMENDLKICIEDVLETLTPREQEIITLRFGLDGKGSKKLSEIGDIFNVSGTRIGQIETKALRKLRHPSRSKKLKQFL